MNKPDDLTVTDAQPLASGSQQLAHVQRKGFSYFVTLCLYLLNGSAYAVSAGSPSVVTQVELLRICMGLGLVIMLIVFLSWLVKRLNIVNVTSTKGFQSIAVMTLGPKEKIMLLKIGSRYLLIGIGSGAMNTLFDFGEQLPEGFTAEEQPSFAKMLQFALRKS